MSSRKKFSKFNKGIEALQKEANAWWGGLNKMEQQLKLSRDFLSNFFWPSSDQFNIKLTDEELSKYTEEKIKVAEITRGRLWEKEVRCYHFGGTYLVEEEDYFKQIGG